MRRVVFGMMAATMMLYLCACGRTKHYNSYNFEFKMGIDDIWLEADGNDICAVVLSDYYRSVSRSMGSNLIELPDAKGRAYSNEQHIERCVYDRFDIKIYEISTKKLIKAYDLSKIQSFLEAQGNKDGISYEMVVDYADLQRYNNSNYLRTLLNYDWSEDEWNIQKGFLYINIDTDEMQIADDILVSSFHNSDSELAYEEKIRNLSWEYLWKSKENSILMNNGFSYTAPFDYHEDKSQKIFNIIYETSTSTCGPGVVRLIVSTNALPKNNQALYKKFPGLKEWQGQEGNMAIFYLSGYPTPEEILRLFVEDDKGISFENCILSARFSRDGKEHKIGSFEELDKWYQSTVARDSEHEAGEESETMAESSV